jgi:Holliday junction resolvase RusA-like endonuclease
MGWALDLFVAGTPAPQGSKSHKGHGVMLESSKTVGDWRSVLAWTAHKAYTGPPITGAVVLAVEFVMPRPKAMSKRKPTPPHTKRPDVDKLLRAVGDALSGVVWSDDSNIVESISRKRYAEPDERPGAHLLVGEWKPAQPVVDDVSAEPAA